MALPNVNQKPAGPSAVNPVEVQMNAMANNFKSFNANFDQFMAKFSARMESVMSPGLAVKQSVYGAFGNNVATRGAMAGFDALSDKLEGIFGDAEDPVDNRDPIAIALEKQTESIKAAIESLRPLVEGKSTDSAAMDRASKSEETLDDISKTLTEILNKECCSDPKLIENMVSLREIADEILSTVKNYKTSKRDSKQWDGSYTDVEGKEKQRIDKGTDLIPFNNSSKSDARAETLKKIILLLGDNNKLLKKISDGPISTAETELERDLEKKRKPITAIDVVPKAIEKVSEDAGPTGLMGTLLDMAKNLLPILMGVTSGLKGAGSLLVSAITGIAGIIGRVIKALPLGKLLAGGAAVAAMGSDIVSSGVDLMKSTGGKMSDAFDKIRGKTTPEAIGKGAPEVLTGNDAPKTVDKTKMPSDTSKKLPGISTPEISDATIKAEKALEEVPKPKGMLGKIGETLGKVGSKAAKLAKFIPGVGMVVGAADMAYSAGKGAYDAEEIFGTDSATRSQRNSAALGGAAESLSFGLLDRDNTAKSIEEFFSKFRSTDNKPSEIDSSLKKTEEKKSTEDKAPVIINTTNNNTTESTVSGAKRNPTRNGDYSFNRYVDSSLRTV